MKKRLPQEIQAILNTQEMFGERMVNYFRFGFALLGLGLLAFAHDANTSAANEIYAVEGFAWLFYALALHLFLRLQPNRYVAWLKYATISLDLILLGSASIATAYNWSGMLEYFLGLMPLTFPLWNLLTLLRLSPAAAIYSALFSTLVNGLVLFTSVNQGWIQVSETSTYGAQAINISDQIIAICFLAVPGIVGAVVTWFSRRLILRAEHETRERARLEKEKSRLGRYLSPDLVDLVLREPDRLELGGIRQTASILFSDIRDFTPFSDGREPEEVLRYLNQYFTRMVTIVFRNGGMLDKFMGDGLMAEFGVPVPTPLSPHQAVIAALQMFEEVKVFNVWADGQGLPHVRIGIGIATGPVVAGNIGSLERMEYTCVSDTVNLASRLQGLNRSLGMELLICGNTGRALQGLIPMTQLPPMKVKGKGEAVQFYAVEDLDEPRPLIRRLISAMTGDTLDLAPSGHEERGSDTVRSG